VQICFAALISTALRANTTIHKRSVSDQTPLLVTAKTSTFARW